MQFGYMIDISYFVTTEKVILSVFGGGFQKLNDVLCKFITVIGEATFPSSASA